MTGLRKKKSTKQVKYAAFNVRGKIGSLILSHLTQLSSVQTKAVFTLAIPVLQGVVPVIHIALGWEMYYLINHFEYQTQIGPVLSHHYHFIIEAVKVKPTHYKRSSIMNYFMTFYVVLCVPRMYCVEVNIKSFLLPV